MPNLITPTHIRVDTLAGRLSVSRATIWRWAKTLPGFPQPIKIGPNVSAWPVAAVDAWLSAQATGSQS